MTSTTAHSAGNSCIYFPLSHDKTLDLAPGGITEMSGLSGVLTFADTGFIRNGEYRHVAQTDKPGLTKFIDKCNDQLFALNTAIKSLSSALAYIEKDELIEEECDAVLFLITGLSEISNEVLNAMMKGQEALNNGCFLETPKPE
jgi:hypothetical protein